MKLCLMHQKQAHTVQVGVQDMSVLILKPNSKLLALKSSENTNDTVV